MTRRSNGRTTTALRPVILMPDFTKWAEGAVLSCFGDTKVLCTASVEDRLPGWMREQQNPKGWVTAEYSMLPRATDKRTQRESTRGKVSGRTQEISRLIGRSLRAAIDLEKLGERSISLDCDVLQADGGTRTAAITGAWVALALATRRLMEQGKLKKDPIIRHVAAVSVGVLDGDVLLDLDFEEDQAAHTDLNVVMGDDGGLIEIQGTAEKEPFSRNELNKMLDVTSAAMETLYSAQRKSLREAI